MQLKYIVATIASLAVATSALPAPEAEEVAHIEARGRQARLADLGTQTADAIKELEETYSGKLTAAVEKNYKGDAKIPTIEEIQKLKEMAEKKQKDGIDRRDPQLWNYGYNNLWGYNTNAYLNNNFRYRLGWQLRYPFTTYGYLWNYNLNNFYTGYGLYQNCGWNGRSQWC